jgi:hypothetical protein
MAKITAIPIIIFQLLLLLHATLSAEEWYTVPFGSFLVNKSGVFLEPFTTSNATVAYLKSS